MKFNRLLLLFVVPLIVACKSNFVAIERSFSGPSDEALKAYIESENIAIGDSNNVEILNGAYAKFKSLFNDIRTAEHHVHLEYFNFRNDSINRELITFLASKAAEGVEVRILFDALGNSSNDKPLKKEHLDIIRSTGIKIEPFDPIKFPWVNHFYHRDHRKIAIIDGKTGYCGGINVADYYLVGNKKVGKWRDMHVRVQGNAVAELQRVFVKMWSGETGESLCGGEYFPKAESSKEGSTVAVVDRYPRQNPEQLRNIYANAINAAKDSVSIVSPYFLPTKRVRKAIKKALEDSVKVEIMISSKSDIKFTPDATLYLAQKLQKQGAVIYLYDAGFNHAKAMSVDGKTVTIGSANLDARSLCYDHENNLFIFNEKVTEEFLKYYNEDKKESRIMTRDDWNKVSLWRRFVGWLGNLFTPFL